MGKNSTLIERLETVRQLNRGRFDYVLERARMPQPTVEEACNRIGRHRNWFYNLAAEDREELERLADELHKAKAIHAQLVLDEAAEQAARVKVDGLGSRDQRVRQAAATEILDRTVGKPEDSVKVKGGINVIWNPHTPPPSTGES